MIAAIIRAQLLSLRPLRRSGRGGRVFSGFASLAFLSLFGFFAWLAMLFFSDPDLAGSFVVLLSGALMFVMLYWQVAPVITASFGASIDLRKLLAYPIPHNTLFAVEIVLRLFNCTEMLLIVGGITIGLLRNPVFGIRAAVPVLGGALVFCLMNILLSAATRNLIERIFLRSRMKEVLMLVFVTVGVLPRILIARNSNLAGLRHFSVLRQFIPSQIFWPWAAPAHVMLGNSAAIGTAALAGWIAIAWTFSRWQFGRGIRFDEQPRATKRESATKLSLSDRLTSVPSRVLPDPVGALMEKELRVLFRIARVRVVYLMSCFFGVALFLPAMARNGKPSTFMLQAGLPLMCLYGFLLLGQVSYWNAFGFDRSAVQAYYSWPVRFRHVFMAKNLTVAMLLIPQILLTSLSSRLIGLSVSPGKILESVIVMLISASYWLGLGNIASVRMPRPMDPDKMNQMSNKMQALSIFAAPLLLLPLALAYWSRWFFGSEIVFAGIVLVAAIIGGILYWVTLDSAEKTAESRRERVITELAEMQGPLSFT